MKLTGLTFAGCALVLLATAAAQLDDCDLDELFADTSSELRRLMAVAITSGDNPAEPVITVVRNHTVCLSVGPTRCKVSSISLVIEYNCTGTGFCPDGGRATEQFDFGCNPQGEWVFDQFYDVDNSRTRNPLADFDTELRTDCGACFPVHPDTENPRTIDPVTHCHVCECGGGVGQNACFDTGIGACCNVYVNDMCAENCPSEGTYVIDPDTFVCTRLCEDLGNTAVGGSVTYTQSRIEGGLPVGSVASVTCRTGYTGGGDITCQNGNWTGSLPECSVVDCGNPPDLENGKVMSLTGTTFESTVTYECDENYLFADDDVKNRTCLASGSWSDEDIKCAVDCGYPPDLENGKVMFLTGTTFGAVVTYECDENYLFADDDVKSRMCLSGGMWSNEDIRCELDMKDCTPNCKNGDINTGTSPTTSGTTQSISLYGCSILLVTLSLLSTIF